jgi:hypothetical protein
MIDAERQVERVGDFVEGWRESQALTNSFSLGTLDSEPNVGTVGTVGGFVLELNVLLMEEVPERDVGRGLAPNDGDVRSPFRVANLKTVEAIEPIKALPVIATHLVAGMDHQPVVSVTSKLSS